MTGIKELLKKIEIDYKDLRLYERAFIHRSYLNEHPSADTEHNERLEFLGDAVLELVVTEHLYSNYRNPEGDLTSWRSAVVNGERLAQAARRLKFSSYIKMSHGEKKNGGENNNFILANTFEAVVGAIYIDIGYKAAAKFIKKNLLFELEDIISKGLYQDSKSKLQEVAQEKDGVTPIYKLLGEKGPDHNKTFEMGVFLGKKIIGKGSGSSKQKAQQDAAKNALKNYS